jgi:hypothetical protein
MSSTNSRRRHIPLGERLEAAERIRGASTTVEEMAAAYGVEPTEVQRWLASAERPMTVADVLASPEERRLTWRAQRLVEMIAASDALISLLTDMWTARKQATGA